MSKVASGPESEAMMSEISKPFNNVDGRRHYVHEHKDKKIAYAWLGIVQTISQQLDIPIRTAIVEEETILHGHTYNVTTHFIANTPKEHNAVLSQAALEWNETFCPNSPNTKYMLAVNAHGTKREQNL